MSSSIGPHGPECVHCDSAGYNFGVECHICHGVGRACGGGPVQRAHYDHGFDSCNYAGEDENGDVWICQTCGCIVPAGEAQHG